MKKIIFCLLLVFLASCQATKSEKAKENTLMRVDYGDHYRTMEIAKVKYSGHSYIRFDGGNGGPAIIHDPDCPCHNNE